MQPAVVEAGAGVCRAQSALPTSQTQSEAPPSKEWMSGNRKESCQEELFCASPVSLLRIRFQIQCVSHARFKRHI